MAYRLRVCCVLRRSGRKNDPVDAIGGVTEDGSRWWLSLQQAIDGAERNRWSFYLSLGYGSETELVIATDERGNKCLKPVPAGTHPQSLSELPECNSMMVEPEAERKVS